MLLSAASDEQQKVRDWLTSLRVSEHSVNIVRDLLSLLFLKGIGGSGGGSEQYCFVGWLSFSVLILFVFFFRAFTLLVGLCQSNITRQQLSYCCYCY